MTQALPHPKIAKRLDALMRRQLFNDVELNGEQIARVIDVAGAAIADVLPVYAATVTTPTPTTPAEIVQQLRELHTTDAGNAEALALQYGDRLRYDHTRKSWNAWDGQRWRVDSDGEAARLAREVARARLAAREGIADENTRRKFATFCLASEGARGVRNTLESAQSLKTFATVATQYDADPWLANAGSVTLDLHTCTARPNDPADYITRRLGPDYDPDATCPRWRQFMGEVFDGDADVIAFVQRLMGYTLTGDTREQKFALAIGGGSNGKSTLLGTWSALMGDYVVATPFDTFDADNPEAMRELATMHGARLVTMIETDEDKRLNVARVKSLTGGDTIKARAMYESRFEYKPQFKIIMAMNHAPRIPEQDRGTWRRILRIPFNVSFEGREDKGLEAKLLAELPGILNWALDGLREWHCLGLNPPPSIIAETERYRAENDVIGQWIADRCTTGRQYECLAGAAWADWQAWCGINNERQGNQRAFGRRLTERGITRRESNGRVFYVGIGLHAEAGQG